MKRIDIIVFFFGFFIARTINAKRKKLVWAEERSDWDREKASSWLCWFQSCPTPLIIDLFRLGCIQYQLILLPSGVELPTSFIEPTVALIYRKLIYGGTNQFRLLPNQKRVSGKTIIVTDKQQTTEAWVQFGGTPRKYQAIDIGPAVILELTLLPSYKTFEETTTISESNNDTGGIIKMSKLLWDPHKIFAIKSSDDDSSTTGSNKNIKDDEWTNGIPI